MKRVTITTLILFCMVLACIGNAGDMTVEKLLDLQNNTVDPKGEFRKATSFMIKQKLSVENNDAIQGEVIQYFKAPNCSKSITYLNGVLFNTKIFNGSQCWTIPSDGKVVQTTGPELELQKIITAMSNPGKNILQIFRSVDLEEVKLDGEDYYRLTCHPFPSELDPIILWIDQEDYLNKRLEMQMWSGGKKIKYTAKNLKYADIGGVKVVEVMEATVLGMIQRFTLEDYQLNVPLKDQQFELIGPFQTQSGK